MTQHSPPHHSKPGFWRDPLWQAVGAIVGILSLAFTIIQIVRSEEATPTSTSSPTGMALESESNKAPSSTATIPSSPNDSPMSYATVVDKIASGATIVVGTKWDQPSIGLSKAVAPEGFDVDVAKAVLTELNGGKEPEIKWKESNSANRETLLGNGSVDVIFATYSITAARKQKVTFGGPYVVAHQDVMVRKDDTSISAPEQLAGKRICKVSGSNSYKLITYPPPDGQFNLDATLVVAQNYSECVQRLSSGNLDAVTTDDLILAGLAKHHGGKFKILGQPFTDEQYGIGLKKGDTKTCEAINAAVEKLWDTGTMRTLLDKWFRGIEGLEFSGAAPLAEGCA